MPSAGVLNSLSSKDIMEAACRGPCGKQLQSHGHRSYLEVAVEQQQGSSQDGVALRHAVDLDVFREAGRVEGLQAEQLSVKHNLQPDSQDQSELIIGDVELTVLASARLSISKLCV